LHPDFTLNQSLYLQRYAYPTELLRGDPVSENLGMIVTIPCFNEPQLIESLRSIYRCEPPSCDVEVIVLINQSERVDPGIHQKNAESYAEARRWIRSNHSPWLKFYVKWEKALPEKQAGVGLARKIVMDEAVRRFNKSGYPEGIIIGFDADSTCKENFLAVIEREFRKHHLKGASIFFEHPLEGDEDPVLYMGITNYELHLRYYIMAQRYAGFPYAFHAIGSCMAVRSDDYQRQGGMNRRKAGEDFYFLHKIIPQGGYMEINDTVVFPSARVSNRVPFGTGKAMMDWMKQTETDFVTYHPSIFESLKIFFDLLPDLFQADESRQELILKNLPEEIDLFLDQENIKEKLQEFRDHTSHLSTFSDRFFSWFNGLKLLQCVHFAQENYYPAVSLSEAIKWLLKKYPIMLSSSSSRKRVLLDIREFNKHHPYYYQKQVKII